MNVLVACEESQEVCKAFRAKGHNAFSCDIQYCSGGHPEWHVQEDVLKMINGHCTFVTMGGIQHNELKDKSWDLIIAHPPCTDLAVSGARHFEKKRADGRQRKSIEFFCKFLDIDCQMVAIENPVCIISGDYIPKHFPDLAEKYNLPRKVSQIIQPYQFGDPEKKTTCLWLKGLPDLTPTNIVEPNIVEYKCKSGRTVRFSEFYIKTDGKGRAKARSKTFPGIAAAMASQWG